MWTRDEAFPFLQRLRAAMLDVGYCVALAGSILYRGDSAKDLDVVLFPHGNIPQGDAHTALFNFGLTMKRDRETMQAGWRERGLTDTKHVEEWTTPEGKRVDVFFLT